MALTDKKIAIIVHDYFEQAEFEVPLKTLKDAGAAVAVISATGGLSLLSLRHALKGDKFQADLLIEEANSEDYDALVLPGGAMNADKLRMEETTRQWVHRFLESGRPLAVICHAPWVLISAGVVKDRRLTSYYTIQDDIKNAGGKWVDQAVVIDQNLITSRKPDDLADFSQAIIDMLSQQQLPRKSM